MFRADYTYEIKEDTLIITDLNRGGKSVTNDIENVLDDIKAKEGYLPTNLTYYDSYGELTKVTYNSGVITFVF